MKPTEAEEKGWIDRDKLLSYQGRGRRKQLDLADTYKIKGFMCGGSGCRLTNADYAPKVRDLFKHHKRITVDDVRLLNFGRHFRINKGKVIVGRNKLENDAILALKRKTDIIFEAKDVVGPVTLLRGRKDKEAISIAAALTARYCDASEDVVIRYGKKDILASPMKEKDIDRIRI